MIKLNHDYHVVELSHNVPAEVTEWLQLKFGPGNGERWFLRWPRIYFADPKDHMMFLLKWG